MHLTITTLLILLTIPSLWAQTLDERIAAVNAVFAGSVQLRTDKQHRLVIDFYNGSDRFRQDMVAIAHLDSSAVSYSVEEDAVVIRCLTAHDQCIEKEIFKLNTLRHTGRSNLPRPPDDVNGERAISALRQLLITAQEELAATPDETRERTIRKK